MHCHRIFEVWTDSGVYRTCADYRIFRFAGSRRIDPYFKRAKEFSDQTVYRLLEVDGVGLEFEDSAIEAIADKALERKTGARGLRAIMEAVMLDLMYRVPSDDSISKCVVDKKMVENNLALDGEEILGIEQDPKKEVKEELAS